MARAIPGFSYEFNKVPVEVRAYVDPFADKPEEEEMEAKDSSRTKSSFSFFKFLMWLFFILFIIALIATIIVFVLYFIIQKQIEEKMGLMTSSSRSDQEVDNTNTS
jgi:flagellar biosynthesis/type III secretory pathway M-ring protein FliF/YscJ